MALATIAEPPDSEESFWIWAQAHANHHYAAIQAAKQKNQQDFDQWVLDPFDPNDMASWLEQHQSMHQQMNQALKINSGFDLSELDWKDPILVQSWFAQNFIEHEAWGKALNLG